MRTDKRKFETDAIETVEPVESFKPEAKVETIAPKPESDSKPMVLVSEMDAYVHERLKSQPKTLDEIEIKSNRERSDSGHMLKLPVELEKYQPRFAFRWINKKKRAIDNALDVIGWNIVQRVILPDLPSHLFTANGVIERGDSILAFMPQKQAEAIRSRPGELSRERMKNLPFQDLRKWEDRGEKYYKPDLGSAESESDSEYSKGNKGIVVQPDSQTIEA